MTGAESAAVRVVERFRGRLGKIERKVQQRRDAGHQPPRVVALEWLDPPFAAGHWVPEQVRRAGGWELLGRDGERSAETTWRAVRDVDPEMLVLMPCGYHVNDAVAEWAQGEAAGGLPEAPGGPPRPGLRRRRVGLLQPTGTARPRRHRDARRDLRPGRASSRPRRSRAGPRSTRSAGVPFRATFDCLWCGTRHTVRGPEDVEGWAQLCPDCVGKAGDNPFLRTRLRAGMAERGMARAGDRGGATARPRPVPAGGRGGPPAAPPADIAARSTPRWSPTTRPARPSTTTGISAAVATPTDRSTTWPGQPTWTRRPCGSTRCRGTARSSSSPRGRAGGRPSSPRAASCGCTTPPRRRSTERAIGSSPTDCAPTSMSAMPGPSPIARSMVCSPASG